MLKKFQNERTLVLTKLTCKVVFEVSEGVGGLVGLLVERDQRLGERLEDALLDNDNEVKVNQKFEYI